MGVPRVTDTTLRDGSHPMAHTYDREQVRAVVEGLDAAGVPVIEVTHGDGLAGSSMQYGFSSTDELDLISEAADAADKAKIAVLLVPGIGTRKNLEAAYERGARVVRVAATCTEADVTEQHIGMARDKGMEAIGFLMMSHLRGPEALVEQASLMEGYGAECVYIVDSAGAMLPEDAAARVGALKEALSIQVGFHAHDNLGLAMGNTLAAIDAGADQIDGCLRGLGAGAGNAQTELIASVLDKRGVESGLDAFALMDVAEYVVAPFMPFQPQRDRASVTIGYAGVYSTFLLHARRLGERFGIDEREILVELGRRGAVAGQEDWILDVASDLARERDAAQPVG
jgi:4-hydroxy 2-oxovalerate aldolase